MGAHDGMRFHPDGTFRILQVADVQEGRRVRPETPLLLARALDEVRPDLVVFTGDQVKGYVPSMRLGGRRALTATLEAIVEPLAERGVPFVATYGNHDCQCGVPNAEQEGIYRALPGCLNASAELQGPAAGTFGLVVRASEGSAARMAVWLADSGGSAESGGYEPFDPALTEWLVRSADELSRREGRPVPGILFQHIPVPEVYDCLRPARPGERGVAAFRDHAPAGVRLAEGDRLVPDERHCLEGAVLEPVCCGDANTGELDALVAQGDFFAAFFGHDHKNTLVARCLGMVLGYAPTASFSSYGPGLDRAVRAFEFREDDPRAFSTRLLTYRELVGETTTRPVRDRLMSSVPVSAEEARDRFRFRRNA